MVQFFYFFVYFRLLNTTIVERARSLKVVKPFACEQVNSLQPKRQKHTTKVAKQTHKSTNWFLCPFIWFESRRQQSTVLNSTTSSTHRMLCNLCTCIYIVWTHTWQSVFYVVSFIFEFKIDVTHLFWSFPPLYWDRCGMFYCCYLCADTRTWFGVFIFGA